MSIDIDQDIKLKQTPIVILRKLPTVNDDSKQETAYEQKKVNFLASLGLVRKNWDDKLSSKQKKSERMKYCCVGFRRPPPSRRRISHCQPSMKWELPHKMMQLSPRVCVKKWLGGENIKVSKHKCQELEESLIPKTQNHHSCREKPKKLLPVATDCESVASKRSVMEENASLVVPHSKAEKSKENWNNHDPQEVNGRVLRSRANICLPNQITSTYLPTPNSDEGDYIHRKPFGKEDEVNTVLKEVRVCLERWAGEGCVVLPKKLNGIEHFSASPDVIRKCRQAGLGIKDCWCVKCAVRHN